MSTETLLSPSFAHQAKELIYQTKEILTPLVLSTLSTISQSQFTSEQQRNFFISIGGSFILGFVTAGALGAAIVVSEEKENPILSIAQYAFYGGLVAAAAVASLDIAFISGFNAIDETYLNPRLK